MEEFLITEFVKLNLLFSPALTALSLILKNPHSVKFKFPPEISTPSFPQLIKLQFNITPLLKSASNASEKVFSILVS